MPSYSSGKNAIAICERSGLKFPYREMIKEPGTGLFIHKSESDGMYNRVDHPQNHIKGAADKQSLRNANPDTTLVVEYLVDESGNLIVVTEQFGLETYILVD